ncbi:MAG: glycosyltransferase, partial [Infirmifilum sp.]
LFKFTTRLLDYVDTIICVSRKQAHIISQYLPNQRKKIAVIYNPIPEDLANMDADFVEKKNWTIYVGGKSYIKGWYIFLKIALETAKIKVPILYKVTNIKTRLPLGNVEFLGRLSHNDVLKLFQQSIALLFPSMWEEPLPYVIIEAGILRTIPIAFEVGGVKEILENTKAERFLVKQLDVNTMLTKIIEVINLDKKEFIDITTDLRDKLIKKIDGEKNIQAIYKVFL